MSWNGEIVIDLDSHIVERADRFYQDYIDPAYREAYQQLCDGVAQQAKAGHRYSLFGSRTSIIEPIETGRPLGTRDTYGLSHRSEMGGGRKAFAPGRAAADQTGGELGRQGPSRGHGSGPSRHRRAVSHARLELLRAARRRLRERAVPRLPSLGRRLLRAGAQAAQVDDRREHARRLRGRRRDQALGERSESRRGLPLTAGSRR